LAVPEPQRVLLESLFVPQDLTDARTSIRSTPTPSPMPCTWLTMPLSERRERQSVLEQKGMRTTWRPIAAASSKRLKRLPSRAPL
jgi:hypothetical protein